LRTPATGAPRARTRLALAEQLNASLLTCDGKLAAAAGLRCHVELII